MGRKNRKRKNVETIEKAAEFNANPFAELDLDLPMVESEPEPEPEPEDQKPELDREDQALLRAFGGDASIEFGVRAPLATIGVQRKGKGGKTITWVRGFERMDLLERMAFAKSAAKDLGTSCRFREDTMEAQGDLRERLAEWLVKQGFRARVV